MTYEVILGECREVMADMTAASVDAIVCDPPYDLTNRVPDVLKCTVCSRVCGGRDGTPAVCPRCGGELSRQRSKGGGFMGKDWDSTGIAFDAETWRHALRVLKPGGHLLAFGGSRTFHRLAVAIEDAGFEIKDCLMWLYGQGFPKHKSLLKPAWEPIILARKPGKGVLNIDGCRIGVTVETRPVSRSYAPGQMQPGHRGATIATGEAPAGRWPANIILDEVAAGMLDAQSGERKSGGRTYHAGDAINDNWRAIEGRTDVRFLTHDYVATPSTGGASRFFYVAKASRRERNAGLDGMPEQQTTGDFPALICNICGCRRVLNYRPVCGHDDFRREAGQSRANHHPTVKPIALMRWLCRLITPPGGLILDPFAGSGSTGCAAVQEGFRFIGIEQDAAYIEIAERRIAYWAEQAVTALPLPLEAAS